jgi:acetylornithine deacetylase/succinyl-diaminopimelate desuccinylase-like protein
MFIRSLLRAAAIAAAAIAAAGAANAADDALGREAVEIFADYLRVDTTNPPGNEIRAADFFAKLLAREGIESTIIESHRAARTSSRG